MDNNNNNTEQNQTPSVSEAAAMMGRISSDRKRAQALANLEKAREALRTRRAVAAHKALDKKQK